MPTVSKGLLMKYTICTIRNQQIGVSQSLRKLPCAQFETGEYGFCNYLVEEKKKRITADVKGHKEATDFDG